MSPKGRKALWRISFVTAWSRPPRLYIMLVSRGEGGGGRKGGFLIPTKMVAFRRVVSDIWGVGGGSLVERIWGYG